jgi:hypothetical protein
MKAAGLLVLRLSHLWPRDDPPRSPTFQLTCRSKASALQKVSLDNHGIEHRTCADDEAWVLCFEPADTLNTGNLRDLTYTAPRGVAI